MAWEELSNGCGLMVSLGAPFATASTVSSMFGGRYENVDWVESFGNRRPGQRAVSETCLGRSQPIDSLSRRLSMLVRYLNPIQPVSPSLAVSLRSIELHVF